MIDPGFDGSDEDELFFPMPQPRRPKLIRERVNYYEILSEDQFFMRFRLKKETVQILLETIQGNIQCRTERNSPISAMNRLLMTLRFYATGSFYIVCGDFCHVSKTTAFTVIQGVTAVIASLRPQFVNMPQTPEEIATVRLQFYNKARFPKILGAIDCTHIRLQSPGGEFAELYRNRKNYFSKNVQVVAGPDLQIFDIVTRWHGSAHDQTIFNASRIKQKFERGVIRNHFLIGDSGYEVLPYLMVPLPRPVLPEEQLYNESLIRTRSTVERLFGVWKRRFPILSTGIRISTGNIQKADAIIVACAVLHNIACKHQEEVPLADPEVPVPPAQEFEEDNVPLNVVGNAREAVRSALINEWFATLL